MDNYSIQNIRKQIIGNDVLIETPFGKRHMLYLDYTASGRGIKIIENKLNDILIYYANTHTEDDFSGKYLTTIFENAEKRIKKIVNAGINGKIVLTGSGATGALKKLQEIIGVYIPPSTRERINNSIIKDKKLGEIFIKNIEKTRPVVFIGPYEHHTNEIMWRESLAEVVVIKLKKNGKIDLLDLEKKISDKKYHIRTKFASFSAGSNVTGIITDVYKIAEICHKYNAFIFFDFAAIAPYEEINMNKDDKSYFDAIFFSPHKFLGGPGSSGVLVFNEKIYPNYLPPTTPAGGTVVYVNMDDHDYYNDIETREKGGTPPIIQGIKAALVLDLKEKIGINKIKEIESEYGKYFLERLSKIKNVDLIENISYDKRLPIIPFNIKYKDKILHPKFVAKLLNDLFGIQCRAGCNCAGPYGHRLLNIDNNKSKKIRNLVLNGCLGFRPGWVRLNIHYSLNFKDIDFIIESIRFIAKYGYLFLIKYEFDICNGEWRYKGFKENISDIFLDSIDDIERVDLSKLGEIRKSYFNYAEEISVDFKKEFADLCLKENNENNELKYFFSVE